MWIKTQDNGKLVNIIEVQIKPLKRYGNRGFWIIGRRNGSSFMNEIKLGKYDTLVHAQIVLSDIEAHINERNPKIYQMK